MTAPRCPSTFFGNRCDRDTGHPDAHYAADNFADHRYHETIWTDIAADHQEATN